MTLGKGSQAPQGASQGQERPSEFDGLTDDYPEMTEEETARHNWAHAQTGWDTPRCDCGHDGMGPAWHAQTCRWHASFGNPWEVARLTTALHANQCHPDWTYAITTGGTQIPPSTGQWGSGWQPNPESPGHGRGTKPANTWWCWKRPRDTEETA